MKIILENLEKKFNQERIFSGLNYEFVSGGVYALTGPNGSGKSTLLQILAGYHLPSSGTITYQKDENIEVEDMYQYISIATPYMDVIEEFTLTELLKFHFKFKKIKDNLRNYLTTYLP